MAQYPVQFPNVAATVASNKGVAPVKGSLSTYFPPTKGVNVGGPIKPPLSK